MVIDLTSENTMIKLTEDTDLITQAEEILKKLGFEQPKLTEHQRILQIRLSDFDFVKAIEKRYQIVEKMKSLGYRFVTLDLSLEMKNQDQRNKI